MSNYTKATNFSIKDGLVTTDPAKIIKGTEIDNEYNAISNAIASKADVNSPSLTGSPTAPTATAGSNTTQIATTAFATAAAAAAFPSGGIIMWSGLISAIPSGWYFCNGSNSTPDLRDKFIIGASADSGGAAKTNITAAYTQTGGSKDAIVISHTHTATVSDPGHTHGPVVASRFAGPAFGGYNVNLQISDTPIDSAFTGISVSNSTTGSSGTNANLPPYYAIAYIMKA
jgi:hypothetical protein